MLVDVDVEHVERVVIPPPLQDLREVSLDAAGAAGVAGVEEDETRPLGRPALRARLGSGGAQVATPPSSSWNAPCNVG